MSTEKTTEKDRGCDENKMIFEGIVLVFVWACNCLSLQTSERVQRTRK